MLSIKNYLVSLLLLQQIDYKEYLLGSWYSCGQGEYYEVHFKDEYLEICPEFYPTGSFHSYGFSGDSILIQGNEGDIANRLEIIHTDTIIWNIKDKGVNNRLVLIRMDTTIIVPDSKLEMELRNQYLEDYQTRMKEHNCRPSM